MITNAGSVEAPRLAPLATAICARTCARRGSSCTVPMRQQPRTGRHRAWCETTAVGKLPDSCCIGLSPGDTLQNTSLVRALCTISPVNLAERVSSLSAER